MDCRDWRERVSAYIDGEIPAGEARAITEHLERCTACRALERKMRALTIGLSRTDTDVSPQMRETLFARLESEGLLPKRRSLFVYSLRWAAIPALAAAGLALFVFYGGEREAKLQGPVSRAPEVRSPAVAQRSPGDRALAVPSRAVGAGNGELTTEEREIIAYLDLLEDPSSFEESGEIDEMDIITNADGGKG